MRISVSIKFRLKVYTLALTLSETPNIKKLEDEVKSYFEHNLIDDVKIESVEVNQTSLGNIEILTKPDFDEELDGGDYEEFFDDLEKKYGVRHVGFPGYYYGK